VGHLSGLPGRLAALAPALLACAALTTIAPPASARAERLAYEDTVITVRRGQVLIGEGFSGQITVEAWGQDRIELVQEAGTGGRVNLRVAGNRISLTAAGPRRRTGVAAVRLRVPAWLPVQLRGGELTATVDGLTGVVDLSSVEGDLALRNMAGDVFASTVEGSVTLERSTGRVRLRSVEQGVYVTRVEAESVLVESTSGDITLEDVVSRSIEASTTEGDILFAGSLSRGGTYLLSTHDGDLTVALPASADALVTVSTFDGEFLPEIPITIERFSGGKEMTFTLGRGGAQLTLTAFDGNIVLRRR
jgi:hypothetical protein